MHENGGFCPMDKKMISPHIEWCIGNCPGLYTIVQIFHMVPKAYALSCSYLDCLGCLRFVFHFYAQTVLCGL